MLVYSLQLDFYIHGDWLTRDQMGNEDLGKHYQEVGELGKAFEAYSRMRADAASQKQIIDVSKHIIEVAIEQRNWLAVTSNVQKIKQIQSTPEEEKTMQPYLCAAEGLALMDEGKFYSAALSFLRTDAGMGASCNTFISPNDVAVYGGLCALASMERSELNKSVLENSNFRTYLELEQHIRKAITFFVNSRYTECLNILESYRADYLLDIHLRKHVDLLYYLVRSKSIVQYFIPFSCVTLDSLNQAFAAPGDAIDKELVLMINSKDLDARIDTQNRVSTLPIFNIQNLTVTGLNIRPNISSRNPPQQSPRNCKRLRARGAPPNPTHECGSCGSRSQGCQESWQSDGRFII
jgi:COP9 signalosome complex subunit 1